MQARGWVVIGACALAAAESSDATACSCVGPHDMFVGPERAAEAPLNVRVRLEVPTHVAGRASSAVVRVIGGANVDTTARTWPDGNLTFVELTPKNPLAPSTRYEVALTDPNAYPSTVVLSFFKTGDAADVTAPKLDTVGTAVAEGNPHAGGGDCSIQGPWIRVGPVKASDPGRPNANLLYGIWLADSPAALDTSKPPNALGSSFDSHVHIGRRSLCDPHDLKLPATQYAYLAIAAVDEAGNTSAIHKLPRVDLKGVGAHP